MTARTPAQVLAQAASTLVGDHDVTDALAHLVRDCADVVGAQAVAIIVRAEDDQLELLTATSHRVTELEVFQLTHDEGPCVDAVRTGSAASLEGEAAIVERWPVVGPVIVESGFGSVYAFPMRWHDQVLGGLNVFSAAGFVLDDSQVRLAQAVADVATLLIIQERKLAPATIAERLREILRGRVTVERAKGVLSYVQDVDMATAYGILLERAASTGRTLTEVAEQTLEDTRNRRPLDGGTG